MENNMEIPPKIKNRTTAWASSPISGYVSEQNDITTLKGYRHLHVHCTIIYNSYDSKTA